MNIFKKTLTLILILFSSKTSAYCVADMISLLHLPKIHSDIAINLVKSSTAILPQFDSIGHHVLQANKVLINQLLELNLDSSLKKRLILEVIDMTRQGDEMGSKILQEYYHFIDYLL